MRFDLSDDEWAVLEPLMPGARRSVRADDRKIMNAIFYVMRTGMPWRDLPERYGPYTTAYNRFNGWSRRGVWKRIFDTLALKSRESLYLIDSTIVKAHRAAQSRPSSPAHRRLGHRVQYRQADEFPCAALAPGTTCVHFSVAAFAGEFIEKLIDFGANYNERKMYR